VKKGFKNMKRLIKDVNNPHQKLVKEKIEINFIKTPLFMTIYPSMVRFEAQEASDLPSVGHRYNTSTVSGNVLEDRLREIKVVLRRVTPPPCIVRQGIVWRAEIGGCDQNGARQAPFGVIHAPDLIARSTA
jgi:hypothetical protein